MSYPDLQLENNRQSIKSMPRIISYLIILTTSSTMGHGVSTLAHEGYNRATCLNFVTNLLEIDPDFAIQNLDYFFWNSTLKYPVLSLKGCNKLCSHTWGPYDDNGSRLLEWIVPVILLLTNVHLPPIGKNRFLGKRRFLTILHILGDPCGATWWHLKTLMVWGACYREASDFLQRLPEEIAKSVMDQEPITVAFASATRFLESQELSSAFEKAIGKIVDEQLGIQERKDYFHALREAGATIADMQTNDMRRTVFAFLLYVVQVVAVFVHALGGSPNPSGGRVSPAMLLIWLIPIALLSNAIGDTVSWRQSERVLVSLVNSIGTLGNDPLVEAELDDFEILTQAVIAPRFSNRRLPDRTLEPLPDTTSELLPDTSLRGRNMQKYLLAAASTTPVLIAFAISFAVDVTPPTYFSCRSVFNISALAGWLISAGITAFLIRLRSKLGKWLSIIVLMKDFLVAVPILVMVVFSTCGYFNSCYCSSGYIYRRGSAHVDLRPDPAYPHNAKVYAGCVAAGLTLEFLFFLAAGWYWRGAFQSIWWIEPRVAHPPDKLSVTRVQESHSDIAIEMVLLGTASRQRRNSI
jgi:hypothetical protein